MELEILSVIKKGGSLVAYAVKGVSGNDIRESSIYFTSRTGIISPKAL
jgi:hypothetical protein